MKKIYPIAIYTLLIINTQRFNNNLNAIQKNDCKKNDTHWTKVQEDAKGKAGVS
ncbi:MAG: hypothetical protein RIS64_1360 [Bacteroidota bacterium]|jgi:hypothetical protein